LEIENCKLVFHSVFFENIKTAWDILWRNKVRSFLTMLGIIIGVMSMIVILAVGAGAQSLIVNQVKSLGSNLVAVLPGKSESTGPPAAAFGVVITSLTYDDGKALVNGDFPDLVAITQVS
jgi:putative ABC transport system permease protein